LVKSGIVGLFIYQNLIGKTGGDVKDVELNIVEDYQIIILGLCNK